MENNSYQLNLCQKIKNIASEDSLPCNNLKKLTITFTKYLKTNLLNL